MTKFDTKTSQKRVAALLGFSSLLLAMPARAEYPALYWSQNIVDYSVADCFSIAEKSMEQQRLQGIEVGKHDVYGHTKKTAVAVTCFSVEGKTVVVVMVTGSDEKEVNNIRDRIKQAY